MSFFNYKKILKAIVAQKIQRHNDTNNNTIDSSKKNDINKSNKNNKSFKKEKIEVIIIDKNEKIEQNIKQILQKNKDINRNKSIKI